MIRSSQQRWVMAVIVAAPSCVPSLVEATTRTWLTASGTWQTASNWSGNQVPQTGDDVVIVNSDAVNRIVTYTSTVSIHSLLIGNGNGGSGTNTLNIVSGELDANLEKISNSLDKGVITQSGGLNAMSLNTATAGLFIGGTQAFPGNGTYSLSGTGALTVTGVGTNSGEAFGDIGGAGTFLQSGGFHSISGSTRLDVGQTGAGTYNLSGGILTVAASVNAVGEIIGDGGAGNFIQSDGTHSIGGTGSLNAGQLILANGVFGTASYTLSGGTLSVSVSPSSTFTGEIIGNSGTALFTQSGGTHSVAKDLVIGANASSNGTYNLIGNGTLSAATEDLGDFGAGTFIQSAGTHSVSLLNAGVDSGSRGDYQLSGSGVLNGEEIVGDFGTATFNQTGGTNNVATFLLVGNGTIATGTYLLSGNSVLSASGDEIIGNLGTGTFNQSGGTNTLSNGGLEVGSFAGSVGTYILSSGMLNVAGIEYVGQRGSGSFNQSGGSNTCNNLMVANIGSAGLDSHGYYSLSNGAVLNTLGGQQIGVSGVGTFDQSGGTNTMTGDLEIGHNDVSFANQDAGHGTYLLSGNSVLEVHGTVDVGFLGSGVFQQSGGTATISGGQGLQLGSQLDPFTFAMGSGVATFSGGICTANSVSIGGTPTSVGGIGTMSINTAGHLIVTGTLKVWDTGITGLSLGPGATLSVGALDVGGNPNQFQWTGGTLQFTDSTADVSSSSALGPSVSLVGGKTLISSAGLSILPGGSLSVAGGALIATNVNNYGAFSDTSGSFSVGGVFVNNGTASFGGSQSWGPASVFVNAAGAATFNSAMTLSGFGPVVVVTGGSVTFGASPGPFSRVAITASPVFVTPGGNKTIVVAALSIDSATGSELDLADNSLIATATPISSIASYIRTAFNGGSWNGVGMTSSSAQATANTAHQTALGYAIASSLDITNFNGQSVNGSDVLVRYTWSGDANLDGIVNAIDFNALATNFGGTAGKLWNQGDFNYDGLVGTSDFALLSQNFNQLLASPALAAVVPEPATLLALFLPLLSRRRLVCTRR